MAEVSKKSSNEAQGFGCLVLLAIIAAIVFWIYTGIDSEGWIPHSEDSVITAQANWFVGESKNCLSYPLDAKTAQILGKPTGYAISRIACDDGPEHAVKITFYGRTEQPERQWINWRCTRNSDSFTCKQLGGL
jgi:hypothetical protein